jgi:Metallo-peptidase family M12
MEILMFNRRLCIALSLGCVLAADAGSSMRREALSAASAHREMFVGGQYECKEIKPLNRSRTAGAASTIVLRINDTQITIERSDATTTADGCTWTGLVQETGESAMLMWWKDGRLTGMLGYKGHIYVVTNAGGEIHAVREVGPRSMPSGAGRADVGDKRVASRSAGNARQWPPLLATSAPEVEPFSDAERQALEAKQITIDLMVLYTRKAASHYIRTPADVIALAVEQTNQSFRNSGLANISLRLVHTQLIDYDETDGEHFGHLYRMVDGIGSLKAIHKLRDEKRADIVGLILDDPSGCGLSTRVGADAEEAYFVAHHSCAAITYSIAHEVGHILGARHDRQADASNAPFAFGHGYVNGNKWRDVMSYQESCDGCPRIPYWSNPRITYKGEPTGTVANDNARVILGQAERVSKFR